MLTSANGSNRNEFSANEFIVASIFDSELAGASPSLFQRWFGSAESSSMDVFLNEPGTNSWLLFANNKYELIEKDERNDALRVGAKLKGAMLARCAAGAFASALQWSLKTQDSVECVANLVATFEIADAPTFWRHWFARLRNGKILDAGTIGDACRSAFETRLKTTVERDYNFDDLSKKDATPSAWWRRELNHEAEKLGLNVCSVDSVVFFAPSIEEQKKMERYRRELEAEVNLTSLQAAREAKIAQLEEQKRQVEHNAHLNDKERQLEMMKIGGDQAAFQRQLEIERLEDEKKRAMIQAEIAGITAGQSVREYWEENARRLETRIEEQLRSIEEMKNALLQGATRVDAAEKVLNGAIPSDVARLVDGLSMEIQAEIGLLRDNDYYSRYFHAAIERTNPVRIKAIKQFSRTIVCGQASQKIDALRFGQSLEFEFKTPVDGYATIINIGTSGQIWLHSPNAYVRPKDAQVYCDEVVETPGKLLPANELRRNGLYYQESDVGPVGMERMLVLITPEPLINDDDLFDSEDCSPFVQLRPKRFERLIERLNDFSKDKIGVGILELVVCPN